MTKLFKRIICFSMAVVISLSLSSTAFAAETVAEDTATVTCVTPTDISVYVDNNSYGNLSGYISGTSTHFAVTFSFTVPDGGAYLYYDVVSNAKPHVYVKRNGAILWNYEVGFQTNGEVYDVLMTCDSYPNGYWPAGTYDVTVRFGRLFESYAMAILGYPVLVP